MPHDWTPEQDEALWAMREAFGFPDYIEFIPVAEDLIGDEYLLVEARIERDEVHGLPNVIFKTLKPWDEQ